MADTNMTTAAMVYQGITINRRDEMLCLTDMWRADGSDPKRRPAEWQRNGDTVRFVEFLKETLNMGETHFEAFQSVKGGTSAGTWAHWQIAFAYAKYLSPGFHAWCNTVVRDRMEGKIAPAMTREQIMASALLMADETMKEQAIQIAELTPKAAAFDVIGNTEGLFNLTAAAKLLDQPPRAFTKRLNSLGWIYKRDPAGDWLGYQDKVKADYLDHRTHTYTGSDGTERTKAQVMVTPRGLTVLAKRLGMPTPAIGSTVN